MVIVHPFLPRMSMWLCITIIAVVWLVAVLISLPLAVYQQLMPLSAPANGSAVHNATSTESAVAKAEAEGQAEGHEAGNEMRWTCQEQWPDTDSRSIFTVSRCVRLDIQQYTRTVMHAMFCDG